MGETIGLKIKSMRKSKGATQEDLALRTGISISAIRKYENGDRSPKIEAIKSISNALGVKISDLMDENEISDAIAENIQDQEIKEEEDFQQLKSKIQKLIGSQGYEVDYENVLFDPTNGDEFYTLIHSETDEELRIPVQEFFDEGEKMVKDIENYPKMRTIYFLSKCERSNQI